MPYHVVGNCVHKVGEGMPIPGGCHANPQEAYAQIAAIERSEGKSLSGFKSIGDGRWVGFFSNIFHDRDIQPDAPQGERFTLDALKEAADWMNSGNMPDLELWHLDNLVVGKADKTYVAGPFLIAEGVWGKDELGRKAQEYFDKSEKAWRMSHGFSYLTKDRIAGEYLRFRPREVTVLTEEWAANPVTYFAEAKNMGNLRQDITTMISEVLGVKPEDAQRMVDEGKAQADKALGEGEVAGVKATDEGSEGAAPAAPVAEAAAPVADVPSEPTLEDGEPTPEPEGEPVSDAAFAELLGEVFGEQRSLIEKLTKQVGELETRLKSLEETKDAGAKAIGDSLSTRVKALEDAETERVELLPKAIKAALLSKRAAGGEGVSPTDAKADIKERQESLKNSPTHQKDRLGWMLEKAGVVKDTPA